jgi:DNA-binding MarR family transcriptional regulator
MEATLFRLVLALKHKCFATETRIQKQRSLTPAEFHGLLAINETTPVSGGDFAKSIDLSASRASRVCTKLMDKGLLTLEPDPHDRRAVKLQLTKKGVTLKKNIESDLVCCEKTIMATLPVQERQRVTQALKSLINSM